VTGFCLIHAIFDLFGHVAKFLRSQTPLPHILQYYGLLLTPTLEYILPASLLLATLYTLWHLTRNNEITAMRASGISFRRITAPFLAVGLICSLLSATVKETITPKALKWTTEFARKLSGGEAKKIKHAAYYNVREHRLWLIEDFAPDQPTRLKQIKITQERPDGSREKEISAEKAEWLDGRWWLQNVQIQLFGLQDQPLPVEQGRRALLLLEADFLTERPTDLAGAVQSWEFLDSYQMWQYLRHHRELSRATRAQKRYDLHSRLAIPWACLVVTLFAVPTGARSARQSALTGIFLAVAFFFGYYALSQFGLLLAKRQLLTPWLGAWLPNMLFSAAGMIMVARMR